MHAKLALLVLEHVVRVITTSANLSERAYRSSIELAVATDAMDGCELPQQVFDDLLGSLERIVRLAPGATGLTDREREHLSRSRVPRTGSRCFAPAEPGAARRTEARDRRDRDGG